MNDSSNVDEVTEDELSNRLEEVDYMIVAKYKGRVLATRKIENPNNVDEDYNEIDDEVQDILAEDVMSDFMSGNLLPEFDSLEFV